MQGPPRALLALSARLGRDPMQVQGPGGNTSIKIGDAMWIKASGTALAGAEDHGIFVAVDRARAMAEARGEGDGTCRAALLDPASALRPSIETTFHALLDAAVVVHTHSVAALAHLVVPRGRRAALDALAGMGAALVPYRQPGRPLTAAIAEAARDAPVILLENHGLIVQGADAADAAARLEEVERRLALPERSWSPPAPPAPPAGWRWEPAAGVLADPRLAALAAAGSYWPDHVVFLGPGLPRLAPGEAPPEDRPAALVAGRGALLRADATPAEAAMLRCLADVLARLPEGWEPESIGPEAEAALTGWDAEAHRRALAAGRGP